MLMPFPETLLAPAIRIAEDEVQVSTVTVGQNGEGENAQIQDPPRLVALSELADIGTRELAMSPEAKIVAQSSVFGQEFTGRSAVP